MPNEKKPLHTICKCAPGVICVCDRRSHDGERMSDTRGAPVAVGGGGGGAARRPIRVRRGTRGFRPPDMS